MERKPLANDTSTYVDDILIRLAVSEDTDSIGMLWEKLVIYHNKLDNLLPSASGTGGKLYARRLMEQLNDTHTCVLVADDHGQVVGFTFGIIVDMVPEMFEQATGGFLADIFVEDAYRGRGIGHCMVASLMEWFRSRGVEHMEWYVASQNDVGKHFWESIGGRSVMIRMRMEL